MVTGQQLLVKKDSDIKSVADLKGKEVCSVTGSTSLDNVEAEGAKPRGFDTYSECRDQVLDGTVDAMTTDGSILLGYAALNPDELEVVGEPFSEERIGVGYSKDSPEMCEWINDSLQEAYDDGSWAEAFELTLGQVRAWRPPSRRRSTTARPPDPDRPVGVGRRPAAPRRHPFRRSLPQARPTRTVPHRQGGDPWTT